MHKVANFNSSRRDALRLTVAAAVGLASARLGRAVEGKELPRLNDSNPAAASLEYTEDTNNVDARKFPKHTAEQRCANCKYFEVSAMSGGPYAPCKLYPGNAVNINGWCAGYVAK